MRTVIVSEEFGRLFFGWYGFSGVHDRLTCVEEEEFLKGWAGVFGRPA
jgi:hypothetical protein